MSKIKRLVIKDCLGIEELSLNLGQTNIISGGNEKNKTAILEIIEKGLYNIKRRTKFVRVGAEKAYIELETDDGLKIARTVKEDEAGIDRGNVKVFQEGEPVKKSPETFLKNLLQPDATKRASMFSFNPVNFMQKSSAEQTDILLNLMPITVSDEDAVNWFDRAPQVNYAQHGLKVLKDIEAWFYQLRHDANQKVSNTTDEVNALFKRLPDNFNTEKWEKVSLKAEYDALRNADQANRDIEKAKYCINTNETTVGDINNRYDMEVKKLDDEKRLNLDEMKLDIGMEKDALREILQGVEAQIKELELEKARVETKIKNLDLVSLVEKEKAIDRENAAHIRTIEERRKEELQNQAAKIKEAGLLAPRTFVDTEEMRQKCEYAEEMKGYIPLAKGAKMLKKRLESEGAEADTLSDCLETARRKPQELLQATELPIDMHISYYHEENGKKYKKIECGDNKTRGLGIDEGGNVTVNGLPLSNMSTSKQVTVCLQIARALVKDSPLKLICVDKVEHLDEDVRAEFYRQVEDDVECQYFTSIVTKGKLKVESN